jgi:hypothetical protein
MDQYPAQHTSSWPTVNLLCLSCYLSLFLSRLRVAISCNQPVILTPRVLLTQMHKLRWIGTRPHSRRPADATELQRLYAAAPAQRSISGIGPQRNAPLQTRLFRNFRLYGPEKVAATTGRCTLCCKWHGGSCCGGRPHPSLGSSSAVLDGGGRRTDRPPTARGRQALAAYDRSFSHPPTRYLPLRHPLSHTPPLRVPFSASVQLPRLLAKRGAPNRHGNRRDVNPPLERPVS